MPINYLSANLAFHKRHSFSPLLLLATLTACGGGTPDDSGDSEFSSIEVSTVVVDGGADNIVQTFPEIGAAQAGSLPPTRETSPVSEGSLSSTTEALTESTSDSDLSASTVPDVNQTSAPNPPSSIESDVAPEPAIQASNIEPDVIPESTDTIETDSLPEVSLAAAALPSTEEASEATPLSLIHI